MKQATKRFYGTLACVAFLAGLTGAFAYSLSQNSTRMARSPTGTSVPGADTPVNLMPW